MNTLEKVKIFITEKYFGFDLDQEIDTSTRLLEDLEIEGDDAVDFFEKFENEFNIDLTSLNLSKFFHGEGFNPLSFFFSNSKKIPLTVGDLILSIEARRWIDPK